MSFAFRVFYSLAMTSSLVIPVLAQSESSSTAPDSSPPAQSDLATWDSLAEGLLEADSAEERAALRAQAGRLTPELPSAMVRLSERLRETKQYEKALAAAQLAIELAGQVDDRPLQALAWEQAGRACTGLRDYSQSVEHFERSLALVEALGDKPMASSLLGRIATAHYFLENYRAALESNLKRLKLKEELNDRPWIASTLYDLTASYQRLGEYPAAVAMARRAIAEYEELNDDGGVARVLILLGNIQLEQSDYEQAIDSYGKAGAIFTSNGDVIGPALAMLNTGEALSGMGEYGNALAATQKALAVFNEQENLPLSALAFSNIGGIYSTLADYERARDYFQRSLLLYEQANRPFGRAEALAAIGNSYRRQGNYARAFDYLNQGLKLLEESGRKFGLAGALTELGDLYLQQGDEKLALEFYQRSQILFEKLGSKDKLAALTGRRGMLEQRRGNYEQALAAHGQSLALYQSTGNRHGIAEAHAMMGESHLLLEKPESARASYRESLKIFEEIGNRNGVTSALTGLARVEQASNEHARALTLAREAALLAEQTGNLELLWELNGLMGVSQMALKETAQAQESFERAVESIEMLRAEAAGGEVARRYFLEQRLSPYHSLVALLVSQGNSREALLWAERSKARVLLDVMQSGRADVRGAMTAAERQKELELRAEIISLNTRVARASRSEAPDHIRLKKLKSLRERARIDYEAFQASLYAAHPELRVQRGESPLMNEEEISQLLRDREYALLEYVVTDDVTYLFTVTRAADRASSTVEAFTIPIRRSELAAQIETLRQQLAGRDLGFQRSASKLYALLLEPAQTQLEGRKTLIIVPDDKLWDLPFQALLAGANRFLIENAAITYAPSLAVFREMTKRRQNQNGDAARGTLLALGNPLPGGEAIERARLLLHGEELAPLPDAEHEVRALGRLYGPVRSNVYLGRDAREDRVKAEAREAGILHFATHGVLNDAAPMYSYLLLAAGAGDDGLLEAWELIQLDLQADLAVLSACETARGRYGAGEGIIGLTWALFVAGVPATVVSQWKVESASTRDLMVSFHRGISSPTRTGKTKSTKGEALRQAALKLLKDPETSHPFYWAGFVLVGDGR